MAVIIKGMKYVFSTLPLTSFRSWLVFFPFSLDSQLSPLLTRVNIGREFFNESVYIHGYEKKKKPNLSCIHILNLQRRSQDEKSGGGGGGGPNKKKKKFKKKK
jgi:hypothetical protein